jgi:hypothetical protein
MEIRNGSVGEIEKFALYNEDNSGEEILVVEEAGKIIAYAQVTDENIYFLESEMKGAGSVLVDYLKSRGYLVAKSVEPTAKGFWVKMGFQFKSADGYGGEDWDWE